MNIKDTYLINLKEQLTMESEKKDFEKSVSEKLGINETNRTALNDLTSNDGSEDPGSQLDTEFSKNNKQSIHQPEDNKTQTDATIRPQPTSGTPPKGEELDAFTNNASKKNPEKSYPKPQAEEILNPKLNSQNDI